MKDKMMGGFAVGRTITSLVLAAIFLLVPGVNATQLDVYSGSIQDVLDNSAQSGDVIRVHSGTYAEDLLVNISPILIRGIDNPVLTNGSPGGNVVTIKYPDGEDYADVIITGFSVLGSTSSVGILNNDCPDIYKPMAVYNNIIDNSIGFQQNHPGDCEQNANAILNFWGTHGIGANRGKPGLEELSGKNNPVSSSVKYDPWLTSDVINGNVTDVLFVPYQDCYNFDQLVLDNEEAGINVMLSDGSLKYDEQLGYTSIGSALYNSAPYYPIAVPGAAIKFFNVFIRHYEGPVGKVTVEIYYGDNPIPGVFEDTLKPYVFTGTRWQAADDVVVDQENKWVKGNFSTSAYQWDFGKIIALVGQTYKVTIDPPQDTSIPFQDKPVLSIKIESKDAIDGVSYLIDGCNGGSCSGVWKPVTGGTVIGDTWQKTRWSITDEEWNSLANTTHTIFFKFNDIGDKGEISWQFVKGEEVPPVSPVQVIIPKAGQKLTRNPVKITWTLPSEENIDSIDIWFDRYGDFNMNGGLNNPLHLATLGGGTSFSWRSPNIQTDTAKILVVVTYMDGTEYYGISENFSIVKGYSFKAYKKAPKPVYNIGSGVSQGVATIGAWFHKPRLPFLV